MPFSASRLAEHDTEVASLLEREREAQRGMVQMVASENLAPEQVLEPLASCASNKYCEGAPGERTYPGIASLDSLEDLAVRRACSAFGIHRDDWYINVQVLSGAPANMCVCGGLLEPGDTILSLHHDHGGHMSHGTPDSLIAKFFHVENYFLDVSGRLRAEDVEARIKELAAQGRKPKMLIAGFSMYPLEVDYAALSAVCRAHNVHLHADVSHVGGIVAADCVLRQDLPQHAALREEIAAARGSPRLLSANPFDFADTVVSTTHKDMRGPRGAVLFARRDRVDCARLAEAVFPGLQAGPHMATVASVAVLFRDMLAPEYPRYQWQVMRNARALADEFQRLCGERAAAGLEPATALMSGGTENHMVVVYVGDGNGDRVNRALGRCLLVANSAPFPEKDALHAPESGIRLGTPFMTSRGCKEDDFRLIARVISRLVAAIRFGTGEDEEAAVREGRAELEALLARLA